VVHRADLLLRHLYAGERGTADSLCDAGRLRGSGSGMDHRRGKPDEDHQERQLHDGCHADVGNSFTCAAAPIVAHHQAAASPAARPPLPGAEAMSVQPKETTADVHERKRTYFREYMREWRKRRPDYYRKRAIGVTDPLGLSKMERLIYDAVRASNGRGVSYNELENLVYGEYAGGGPLTAGHTIKVMKCSLNKKLRALGLLPIVCTYRLDFADSHEGRR